MTEPRTATPEEAQRRVSSMSRRDPTRWTTAEHDRYRYAFTVATEPARTGAAIVDALEDLARVLGEPGAGIVRDRAEAFRRRAAGGGLDLDPADAMVAHAGHGRFAHGACSWVRRGDEHCDAYLMAAALAGNRAKVARIMRAAHAEGHGVLDIVARAAIAGPADDWPADEREHGRWIKDEDRYEDGCRSGADNHEERA